MAIATLKLGPADQGRHLTLEEFRDAEEEEGYRFELARGVLEVSEIPDDNHGLVVCHLYEAMSLYCLRFPGAILRFGGAHEFRLWLPGIESGRNPDLGVVLVGTPEDPRGRRPPSLVAEVVSEDSEERDYQTKRQEYLAFGLREYWIVDPRARRVTLLLRDGMVWVERLAEGDQRLPSLVLPAIETRAADLWVGVE
jgi:Uma2 family endonuclease